MSVSLNPLRLTVESVPGFSRSTDWLESQYTNEDSEFMELMDSRIHYREEGNPDNQTYVLLHGNDSSLHTWDGWVDELRDDAHLVRLDMPGFGLTGPRHEGEHTLQYLVNTVGAFCDRLGLTDIVLVGNSLGGGVAWRMSTERSDLISGTILISAGGGTLLSRSMDSVSTPLFANLGVSRLFVRLLITDAYGNGKKPSTATLRRYHDLLLRDGNRDATRELSRTYRQRHPETFGPRSLFPSPASLNDPDPAVCDHYSMSDIDVPVLFQWGDQDRWLPLSFGKDLAERIPGSLFITYEGVGHIPMEEAPVETAADAHEFVSHLSPTTEEETLVAE